MVKYNKKPRRAIKKGKKVSKNLQSVVKKCIAKTLNKSLETKKSIYTSADGIEIFHNNAVILYNALLYTTTGVLAPNATNVQNRIGDKINLRGVNIKMMVELNERYSDVTFRFLVVRAAKGDVPTRSTLYNGISGNKMLDTVNTDRYSVLGQKWFKIKAPNSSALGALGAGGVGSGINGSGTGVEQIPLSRATKIVQMWIPGSKFSKSGVISYEDNGGQTKFF